MGTVIDLSYKYPESWPWHPCAISRIVRQIHQTLTMFIESARNLKGSILSSRVWKRIPHCWQGMVCVLHILFSRSDTLTSDKTFLNNSSDEGTVWGRIQAVLTIYICVLMASFRFLSEQTCSWSWLGHLSKRCYRPPPTSKNSRRQVWRFKERFGAVSWRGLASMGEILDELERDGHDDLRKTQRRWAITGGISRSHAPT